MPLKYHTMWRRTIIILKNMDGHTVIHCHFTKYSVLIQVNLFQKHVLLHQLTQYDKILFIELQVQYMKT